MKKQLTYNSNIFLRQAILHELRMLKEQEPEKFIELFHSLPENHTIIQIGWLKSDDSLKIFYDQLEKYKLIDCEWEFFKNHFKGIDFSSGKIVWKFNLNELVYLIQFLREENVIPTVANPHKILQEHFLDKYGKPLKAGSLRTLLEKGISTPERKIIVGEILKQVLNS